MTQARWTVYQNWESNRAFSSNSYSFINIFKNNCVMVLYEGRYKSYLKYYILTRMLQRNTNTIPNVC